ncbi:MAG: glutamate-1-semialdehyde 2,1-aminomutase [Thermoanaerobaculum sp.]|nr:glutamate-1-semialdehyde 2,1-aminomutase [Thermoanaerobaculum sp.]
MQRATSEALYQRACQLLPAGVNSPVRAFRAVGGTPVFYRSAKGSRFTDVDGNTFVDYVMSWGPLILGHAHPEVVEAVTRAAGDGLSFGAPCPAEVALAEKVVAWYPSCELVRFVSSGTEAVMAAIRLARGYTGKPRILKFEGCYHGHCDALLVKAGSGLATFGTPSSAGVPGPLAELTVVVPLDDEASLEEAFLKHGEELAAAIIEPIPANAGLLLQRRSFLEKLASLCRKHQVLLIFDEVISGFRVAKGGAAQLLGITPDLVTFGKVIGGGMPVGAFGGRREVMEQLAPLGPVYQAGTLSGNPVAMAAGLATLQVLERERAWEQLEVVGAQWEQALRDVLQGRGQVVRVGSIFWLYLDPSPAPRRFDAIVPQAAERYRRLHRALLERGVYLAPSAFEVGFLSTAHSAEDLSLTVEALAEALREVFS